MASQIPDLIVRLRTLRRSELLGLWKELYKKAAPAGIRREILIPFLAYRIQENAFGGLKPAVRTELLRVGRAAGRNNPSVSLVRQTLRAGTRLLRTWRGQTHEVFATDSGYEYRGVNYQNLSEIARKITGTRWSGPAFFGLNKATSVPGRSDA